MKMSIDDAIIFLTDDLPELLKDNPNTTEYVLEAAKMGVEALEEKKRNDELHELMHKVMFGE